VRTGRVGQPRHRGRRVDAARHGRQDRYRSRQADRGVAHRRDVRRARAAVQVPQGAHRQAGAGAPARRAGALSSRRRVRASDRSDSLARMTDLLVERRGTTAWVTLNRPDVRNALSRAMNIELSELATELDQDPDVRAAVITGSGDKSFSAGADLKERRGLSPDEVGHYVSAISTA